MRVVRDGDGEEETRPDRQPNGSRWNCVGVGWLVVVQVIVPVVSAVVMVDGGGSLGGRRVRQRCGGQRGRRLLHRERLRGPR
jgi:hypothetical protein